MIASDFDQRVKRPWGSFLVVRTGPGHLVKVITVEPGQKLSLQRHERRSERWVVLSGFARVLIGNEAFGLGPGDDARVAVGVTHRISNPGDCRLEILETQFGDYLDEDDIVRLEDVYGRV